MSSYEIFIVELKFKHKFDQALKEISHVFLGNNQGRLGKLTQSQF